MHLSNLGIFHTIIGVVAIVAAIIDFVQTGKIRLNRVTGKIYFYCTVIASLTALGLSKHGGFNPGHIFALFIVLLVSLAYYFNTKKQGNNKFRYLENFSLSFSFFLSLIPTVNETFTRVPVGNPLATGPTDPLIGKTLLFLLVLFIVGSIFQFRKQKKTNRHSV
ncbi:hypothetical protein V1389_10510 [Flavobacterium rakeshii]|uniref:hypothetical protein n=1 Tax=Flavobacterium rakeshii TaxID=1038845 RepID=UPI002E7B942C|nr:hypothetical protein [Flavobacterium rakeshii]MEE1898770.1 hypothetical protein [Flavobacterium rakeshii]